MTGLLLFIYVCGGFAAWFYIMTVESGNYHLDSVGGCAL